jgi:hypothetical protein
MVYFIEYVLKIPERLESEISKVLETKNKKKINRNL